MLAAFLLLAGQDASAQAPGAFDRVIVLEIAAGDPAFAGRGASQRVEYSAEFSGILHAWVQSTGGLATFVHIEDQDGKSLADDDGANGRRTPYARSECEPGSRFRVLAGAAQPGATGKLELHLAASVESEATRAEALRAQDEIREIKRLRTARDFAAARKRAEALLESFARVDGDSRSELLSVQAWALGFETKELGFARATDRAWGRALEHRLRTAPDDHVGLQATRAGKALALRALGDLQGARALEEKVLAVRTATLPAEDPDLQKARGNLAITIKALGDLAGARKLEEQVLEIDSRTLPDGSPELQAARQNLAITLASLGEPSAARVLFERVLEADLAALPDDSRLLQGSRGNLAIALKALGDHEGARALEEKTLEVLSRTLPADHADVQSARLNLASTDASLGDFEGARALLGQVVAVREATLPAEHPDLQLARMNLASMLRSLGDLPGARALHEQVLEVAARTLPADHPDLQKARMNLAATLLAQRELPAARALFEQVLEVRTRTLPDEHPSLRATRLGLAQVLARESHLAESGATPDPAAQHERARQFAALAGTFAKSVRHAAELAILSASSREAEERCAGLTLDLGVALSFADGMGVFPPDAALGREAFLASETTRDAAQASAALARIASTDARYLELRKTLRAAGEELARAAQKGGQADEFRSAVDRRDGIERQIVQLARGTSGGKGGLAELDLDSLAQRIGPHAALVAYRCYSRWNFAGAVPAGTSGNMCAFVVRAGGELRRVELGPLAPIDAAVAEWRNRLGAPLERGVAAATGADREARLRGAGVALRQLIVDPLLPALEQVERVVCVLDGTLHAVPLDALPLEAPDRAAGLLGERFAIEMRLSLRELLAREPAVQGPESLVALGGASFNSEPLGPDAEDTAQLLSEPERAPAVSSLLRGGAWEHGFDPLTYTGLEARGVAALFGEVFGEKAPALVLEKRRASRLAAAELAPRARWLHLATHGWFAPQSVRSSEDPEPIDKLSGFGQRMGAEERVRGASPMVLCGLALAGANLPANAVGRYPGLVTAEEIATWDLSNCELAALSACDTNVGLWRAGQGVASLQKALHMAGARSVITSLWKVPDEATKELMLDFYRRVWVEKKPKARALWEAKLRLRAAQDERGQPKYTLGDWAGWVLSGAPD
jgi:CHAT domain-containing protein